MALGDGITWDESQPTDATAAIQADDYFRDIKKGIRGRMALEHEFPASQSVTAEAGMHKFITFQAQASAPTISGTQIAGLYVSTANALTFINSAGTSTAIVLSTTSTTIELRTNDTGCTQNGRIWMRTDL